MFNSGSYFPISDFDYGTQYLLVITGDLEDYYSLTNVKKDYIDGIIMIQSSSNVKHEEYFMSFANAIYNYVKDKKLGRVFGSRLIVSMGIELRFEPDIFFVSNTNTGKFTDNEFNGVPDLVVEIITNTTRSYDLTTKRKAYQLKRVPEICLIDTDDNTLIIDTYHNNGYSTTSLKNQAVPSTVIKGFRWKPFENL